MCWPDDGTYPNTVLILSFFLLFQEFDMSVEELSETLLQIKVCSLLYPTALKE